MNLRPAFRVAASAFAVVEVPTLLYVAIPVAAVLIFVFLMYAAKNGHLPVITSTKYSLDWRRREERDGT